MTIILTSLIVFVIIIMAGVGALQFLVIPRAEKSHRRAVGRVFIC